MYDNFKIANYSNVLLSPGFYGKPLAHLFAGEVIDGFGVIPSTGLNVTLQWGNGLIRSGTGSIEVASVVSLVWPGIDLSVSTPDASNPRLDLVVIYVDNSVKLPTIDASNPPTAANLDGPGVVKAVLVAGTPSAVPSAPTATAIQSAVGAGNDYIVVASVRVDKGVSVIASNKITDMRNWVKLGAQNIDSATFQMPMTTRTLGTGNSVIGIVEIPASKFPGSGQYQIKVTGSVNVNFGGNGTNIFDAILNIYVDGVVNPTDIYTSKPGASTYSVAAPVSDLSTVAGGSAHTVEIRARLGSSASGVSSIADRSDVVVEVVGRA